MHHPRTALVSLALAGVLAAACGGDDTTSDTAPEATTATDAAAEPGGSVAEELDAGEALDSVGLEAKASAIESAMGEDEVDRIEVDGDTIHVYLTGGTFEPTMACMVTNAVLSEGEQAVMHLDGETTPCS